MSTPPIPHEPSAAERAAAAEAARRAHATRQPQPRLGRRRRRRRERVRRRWVSGTPRTVISLLIVVAVVVLGGRAIVSHPLGTPSPGKVTGRAVACDPTVYPAGAQYTFEWCSSSGVPVHWARCSVVHYSLDAADAPPGYLNDVNRAIGELASATGLRLERAHGGADISIAWDPSLYEPVPGTIGEAGVTRTQTISDASGIRIDSAVVRISSHLTAGAGAASAPGEEPVLLHELGHAAGLGHYRGAVVMNPIDQGFPNYQPGDLAGMAALYNPTSCG